MAYETPVSWSVIKSFVLGSVSCTLNWEPQVPAGQDMASPERLNSVLTLVTLSMDPVSVARCPTPGMSIEKVVRPSSTMGCSYGISGLVFSPSVITTPIFVFSVSYVFKINSAIVVSAGVSPPVSVPSDVGSVSFS
jgi:hypothetical protein